MNSIRNLLRELKCFLILWFTQALSSLGSAMTNFALIIWCYQQEGSALSTALLSVCSYLPYVLMSPLAGALSDRWNKKLTMLASDSFAALCTVTVLVLQGTGRLAVWHLYVLNALNSLMETVQDPAASVAVSLLIPPKHYQKASGLRSFSGSLVKILTPAAATAVLALAGLQAVLLFDLATFAVACGALLFFVKLPEHPSEKAQDDVRDSVLSGLRWLREHRGILDLILFLAAVNFTSSAGSAALTAMLLSRKGGGEAVLGAVNTVVGIAALAGSVAASALPAPKSRVRVVCDTLLFSMSTEYFFLAFGRSAPLWGLGELLGWLTVPVMDANLDVLLRSHIPIAMQGRVYAARNAFQFFTIPVGYFLGGLLVDRVFEPLMAALPPESLLTALVGSGKGSGAAALFLVLAVLGIATCLLFRRDPCLWALEERDIEHP